MDVQSLVDVHLNDFLLIFMIVKGPFFHAILIVPAGRVHTGGIFVDLVL